MYGESLDSIAKRYIDMALCECKEEIARELVLKGVDLKIVVDVTKVRKDIIIDEIGNKVIKLRAAKKLRAQGWTIEDLSESLGITKKELQEYEKINQIYKNLK